MFDNRIFKIVVNLTLLTFIFTGQVEASSTKKIVDGGIIKIPLLNSFSSYQTTMAPGDTIRVSINSSGAQSNSGSDGVSISTDGRYIAFISWASNLVNGDTNGVEDAFVRDTQTNTTTRVSLSSSGIQGNARTEWQTGTAISGDGRYIVFASYANNLVTGDTNGELDIFVRDMQTGSTTRVSVDSNEIQGNSASYSFSISANGQYVAFQSFSNNLVTGDTNGVDDIFVRDLWGGTTSRISTGTSGIQGNAGNTISSSTISISADGRFVTFNSYATNLVVGDNNGYEDIFLRDTSLNTTALISIGLNEIAGNGRALGSSISANGRFVAFSSTASNLIIGDTNVNQDIFIRDIQLNITTRVSVDSNGTEQTGHNWYTMQVLSISGNGRFVTFATDAGNLVSGDTNGEFDIFVRDIQLSTTTRVSVNSNGSQSRGVAHRPVISADGLYTTFTSGAYDLVNGDTNGHWDIFVHKNNIIPLEPPLIIVHGFQGANSENPDGFSCDLGHLQDEDIKLWDSNDPNSSNPTLGNDLPEWLEQEGYQVWIAHLESSKNNGTPVLEYNAQCLKNQINYVYSQNPQKITIVAHSMGGLVSRAAINYTKNPQSKISSLFTLGSPHAGLPSTLTMVYGSLSNQDAVFNMVEESMNGTSGFNGRIYNQEGIDYYFIGGDASPVKSLGPILYGPLGRKHDGLVSSYSALGWKYPNNIFDPLNWANVSQPHQYYTDEVHISDWGNSYYTAPPGDLHSYSFECIKNLLKHLAPNELFCQDVMTASSFAQNLTVQSAPDLSTFTELKNGHLINGQSISIPLAIDTNTASLFYLTWSGETPAFTLTRPDAQVINPAYAAAHPSEVIYENFVGGAAVPPNQTYNFNTTQLGSWQLNITASTAIDYQAFAVLDSSRSLTAQTNANLYQIGDIATITANLSNGGTGLNGATVTAKLTRSDAVVDTISLTGQGNGTYTANYVIPNSSGYLTIDITANGTDSGTAFTRQNHLQVAIQSDNLQLTGTYDDQPRDDNSDSIYEYLDFMAEVNLTSPGEYAVSAELYAGDQLITQSGDFFQLAAGTQTVTLPFDGGAIREAGLNGPYTVKNLYFTPIDIGITAANVENAWTTSAYNYTQFGTHACYILTLSHTGSGSNPTTSLANSTGCANGEYMTSEVIDLTASPNPTWHITSWTGTNDDSSVASLNTLTMPANNHTVSVIYQPNIVQLQAKSQAATDGWILESTETSGLGGTMNSAATTFNLGDNAVRKQYRSILSFNTASLPDNAVITKVTLKLKKQGITGGGNPVTMFQGFMVDIKKGAFGTAPLALTDFKATASKTVGPQSPALNAGWYNLNLTPAKAYINKLATGGGLTQIRLRFKLDDNNNAIANILKIYSGNAGAANRPQLVIEYYTP